MHQQPILFQITEDPPLAPSTEEAVLARAEGNRLKRQLPDSIADLLHAEDAVMLRKPLPLPIEKAQRTRSSTQSKWPRIARPIEVPKLSHAERQRRLTINNAAWAFPALYANAA